MTTGKPPVGQWVIDEERQQGPSWTGQRGMTSKGGVPSATDLHEQLDRATAPLDRHVIQPVDADVELDRVAGDLDRAKVRLETLARHGRLLRDAEHSDMAAQALLARPLRGLPVELRRLHEDRVAGDLDQYHGWRRLRFVWNFRLIQGRKLRRALTSPSVAERLP